MRRALLAAVLLLGTLAARGVELPAEPGAVWDPADSLYEETRTRLAAAVLEASRASGQKVLVVASRPDSILDSAEDFERKAVDAWPDRTILFALRRDWKVRLVPSASARPMLTDPVVAGFQKRIERRFTNHDFDLAIASVLGDLGKTMAGRPPEPWVDWKHPLYLINGGQDTRPAPVALGVGLAAVLGLFLVFFLYALITNPKRVLAEIAVDGAQIVIGGLLDAALGGGGGGSGGSGFAGGGGSSGGGGASGSW